ncbi:MAG TPA: NTP transferase domain-containing protein [Candidatus Binatia bacterium]|nr:NTP transferase domain-containing protein [Candidatus Binatia bacterium]
MTVAALILAPDPEAALAPAGSTNRLRRIVDVAWSGGAVPTIVVGPDPEGRLAAAIAGAEASALSDVPLPPDRTGAVLAGQSTAVATVEATDAVLLWPVAMAWVDPETVTSLIEAHGADRTAILRPAYAGRPGWPILVPRPVVDAWRTLPAETTLEAAIGASGVTVRLLELGDPGTAHDATTPPETLPPYVGPLAPAAGHVHEWGEAITETEAADPDPVEPPRPRR